MSRQHTDQLCKTVRKRLATLLRSVIRTTKPVSIDVTMYWPPDAGQVRFLISTDKRNRDWGFEISHADWSVKGVRDPAPTTLRKNITAFFRDVYTTKVTSQTKCYLRLHDDDCAIDLGTGRSVKDKDRPELSKDDRLPFSKPKKLLVNRKRNREQIRRGDAFTKVQDFFVLDSPASPTPNGEEYAIPNSGITVGFNKRKKVAYVYYTDPFRHKICDVWIGLHAWEVNERLGPPIAELLKTDWDHNKTIRTWEYKLDSQLFLHFDHRDRLVKIAR